MLDNELKLMVLGKYYDKREKGLIPISKDNFGDELDPDTLLRISDQLYQQGLIDFKPFKGDDRILAGFGQITARGVDLIEKNATQTLRSATSDKNGEYLGFPIQPRLFIDSIDSFLKVHDVTPAAVGDVLKEGYLDKSEDAVQIALERILNVSLHKKDWGGEINDLYTCNVILKGIRIETAFMLKGNGLKSKVLEIKHCGKNGDQLVRLFDSPARLFIVQFVGTISESVIRDIEGKVNLQRAGGKSVWYCIIDGQDTARLLKAYSML